MVREENRDARVTPEITEKPQIMNFAKNEERSEVTETPKPEKDNVQTVRTEAPAEEETATAAAQVVPVPEIDLAPETLADYDYLMNHFFIVDSATETTAEQINAASFLAEDLTLQKETEAPQILIYHSHSQETFCDSREGKEEDTIVGVGAYLTKLLSETYGYQVMHVTEKFDLAGGELDRSKAYDYARAWLEPVLKENPSIQVVIDLHRDGVPDDRRLVTEINGKETAQLLFYNGLSHTINSGDLSYLPNPYIQDNLAFSFQLEYQAALYYPELYRGIYLAGLRYNLHLRPRALLLEAGAQTNTVQEVKNAMEPFADILDRVLQGK
ncbi:stage II sporulation protein P [Blautia obeum]|nr:stage II sporulation protein P [Blautia obeum]